jgi:hypothetical protein
MPGWCAASCPSIQRATASSHGSLSSSSSGWPDRIFSTLAAGEDRPPPERASPRHAAAPARWSTCRFPRRPSAPESGERSTVPPPPRRWWLCRAVRWPSFPLSSRFRSRCRRHRGASQQTRNRLDPPEHGCGIQRLAEHEQGRISSQVDRGCKRPEHLIRFESRSSRKPDGRPANVIVAARARRDSEGAAMIALLLALLIGASRGYAPLPRRRRSAGPPISAGCRSATVYSPSSAPSGRSRY